MMNPAMQKTRITAVPDVELVNVVFELFVAVDVTGVWDVIVVLTDITVVGPCEPELHVLLRSQWVMCGILYLVGFVAFVAKKHALSKLFQSTLVQNGFLRQADLQASSLFIVDCLYPPSLCVSLYRVKHPVGVNVELDTEETVIDPRITSPQAMKIPQMFILVLWLMLSCERLELRFAAASTSICQPRGFVASQLSQITRQVAEQLLKFLSCCTTEAVDVGVFPFEI